MPPRPLHAALLHALHHPPRGRVVLVVGQLRTERLGGLGGEGDCGLGVEVGGRHREGSGLLDGAGLEWIDYFA